MNPWPRISVSPSLDHQPGDKGLLDEHGAAVHSVDQVTLLPPAEGLDSTAAATPELPIVETVPDDDFVHDGSDACATSVGTASLTTHRQVVWDILLLIATSPMHSRIRILIVLRLIRHLSCATTGESQHGYPRYRRHVL
jgi:hypothetical protein